MKESIEERLLSMRQSIEEKRAELNRLEGQRDEPLKALKAEFNEDSLAAAKKRLGEEQAELTRLDAQLDKETRAYAKKYPQLAIDND